MLELDSKLPKLEASSGKLGYLSPNWRAVEPLSQPECGLAAGMASVSDACHADFSEPIALVLSDTVFSCRKCRLALFREADLGSHTPSQHGFSHHRQVKERGLFRAAAAGEECTSYFLEEPQPWMEVRRPKSRVFFLGDGNKLVL